MAQDVLIKADVTGLYDIQIDGADFASAEGFETAIPVSYFTDARASAVQVPDAQNRRGWVGNIITIDQDRELGGLLWLLDQARNTEDTRNFAKAYAEASLQYMLTDSITKSILITVEKNGDTGDTITTYITNIDNTVQGYVTLWRSTDFTRIIP